MSLINQLYELGARRAVPHPPTSATLAAASHVFFAVFTRYGDTLISIQVIRELLDRYPHIELLVFTPPQMVPYFHELLPKVRVISLKKRNPFNVARGLWFLGKQRFDIGYNPWSQGHESCYFISRCKYYSCFKTHSRPKIQESNLYDILRLYMSLPSREWKLKTLPLASNYHQILLCPQTTKPERNLDVDLLKYIAAKVKERYPNATITIAAMDKSFFIEGYDSYQLKKNASSSQLFIDIMKSSDLVICADSAPIHLATILEKDNIAIFFSTSNRPEVVLNSGAKSIVLELDKSQPQASQDQISQALSS